VGKLILIFLHFFIILLILWIRLYNPFVFIVYGLSNVMWLSCPSRIHFWFCGIVVQCADIWTQHTPQRCKLIYNCWLESINRLLFPHVSKESVFTGTKRTWEWEETRRQALACCYGHAAQRARQTFLVHAVLGPFLYDIQIPFLTAGERTSGGFCSVQ